MVHLCRGFLCWLAGYTELCLRFNGRLDRFQATPGFGRSPKAEDGQGLVSLWKCYIWTCIEKLVAKLLSQCAY